MKPRLISTEYLFSCNNRCTSNMSLGCCLSSAHIFFHHIIALTAPNLWRRMHQIALAPIHTVVIYFSSINDTSPNHIDFDFNLHIMFFNQSLQTLSLCSTRNEGRSATTRLAICCNALFIASILSCLRWI